MFSWPPRKGQKAVRPPVIYESIENLKTFFIIFNFFSNNYTGWASSKASKKGKVGAKDSDEEGCELAEHVTIFFLFFLFCSQSWRLRLGRGGL